LPHDPGGIPRVEQVRQPLKKICARFYRQIAIFKYYCGSLARRVAAVYLDGQSGRFIEKPAGAEILAQ
jgi:hypothetical protein